MADIAIELCTWDLLEGKAEGGQLVVQAEEVVEAPFHCCLLFPSVSPAWERAWSICGWSSQVTLSCWYSALILQPSSAMPFNFKGHLQLCALISPVGCTHFPLHPLLWHLIPSFSVRVQAARFCGLTGQTNNATLIAVNCSSSHRTSLSMARFNNQW